MKNNTFSKEGLQTILKTTIPMWPSSSDVSLKACRFTSVTRLLTEQNMSEKNMEEKVEQATNSKNISLPMSRVRLIMKSSPDVSCINQDALFLTTKATVIWCLLINGQLAGYLTLVENCFGFSH